MLEGLERDDVSNWPEGIFRRAYVRAYASAVGLNPEVLVREFLEVHPDPVVTQPESATELEDPQWPAGFRRLVNSAKAVVPSRQQRSSSEIRSDVFAELPFEAPTKATHRADLVVQAELSPSPSVQADERRPGLSLPAAAELCTRLGRVMHRREVAPILEDTAVALDAVGLIVWTWDSRASELTPSLAYGYEDEALSRLPRVRPDADNAIATAFQSSRPCIVDGGHQMTGAVAVPLLSHGGCAGVLAIELRCGDEHRSDVLAFAAILAAQLVTLVGSASLAEAVNA